uniref:SAP domain-containing protein n=1 Tax=Monopterus albus TaxID=43700 RepID=A0A3Q3JAN3_MONAL
SPIEHHGIHQLPVFNSLPELSGDQLLSDFSAVALPLNQSGLVLPPATEGIRQPMSVTPAESNSMATTGRPNGMYLTSQPTPLLPKTARPPSPTCSSSLSPPLNFNNLPHSRKPRDTKPKMRKLKYHQYIPPDQRGKSTGAVPMNPQPLPATANHTSMHTSPGSKPELLPANLVDLTVSELRQQLRKRGLPVSGTKPALLQRLRPFQLPHACLTPTPLSQLGTSMELLTSCPPLPASQSPSSSSSSGPDSPSSSPNRGIPNGILSDTPNGILKASGLTNAASVGLAGEQCGISRAIFLAPTSSASGTPSPTLPLSSSSPLQSGTLWTIKKEQQELSVELEMRERIRSRPRDRSDNTGTESCGGSLHPFLQQGPGYTKGKPETNAQTEVLFTCDVIGQDYELPVQITASPVQTVHSVRSLEEELQEAIQKAQMDPRQSIDDILDEPITCVSIAHSAPSRAPSPQAIQSQSSQQYNRDDNFLPSPLCSSLLLELPPSPAVINPSQVVPAPPPPLICISPLPSTGKSRK